VELPYLKRPATIPECLWEKAQRDGHGPTDEEVVQLVDYRETDEIAAAKAGMDVKTGRKSLRPVSGAERGWHWWSELTVSTAGDHPSCRCAIHCSRGGYALPLDQCPESVRSLASLWVTPEALIRQWQFSIEQMSIP
jgi:hypothetical protein